MFARKTDGTWKWWKAFPEDRMAGTKAWKSRRTFLGQVTERRSMCWKERHASGRREGQKGSKGGGMIRRGYVFEEMSWRRRLKEAGLRKQRSTCVHRWRCLVDT